MAEKDVVDTPTLFLVVGTGTMLTIATVFAVQALFHWGESVDFARKNANPPERLHELRTAATEQIHEWQWVDKDKQSHARIDIERAKQLVLSKVKH